MSCPFSQMTLLRRVALRCVVVSCFAGFFFMYYKPDISFPSFDVYMKRDNRSKQHANATDVQEGAEPDTVVLIWMWPFGFKLNLSCDTYNVKRCLLTADKSLYDKAHGVLIHHRDIRGDNLPKDPRPWFQKWVWFNMESPSNSHDIPHIDELFNLTCNYRLDSNIPVPYGHLEPRVSGEETLQVPPKDKLVCWIVSNWHVQFRRVQFYNELKKHVNVSVYGKAFEQPTSEEEYDRIVSGCKFYLAFENSVHQDYISDKLYRPMILGTVPVTLGPPRQNYEDHVPADSFIHVEDFRTAKQLAERLLDLDRNDDEYMRYFDWRKRFDVTRADFGRTHACRTCTYLQKNRGYQACRNLKEWYWG
ncbi:4-galactosyl-N-acetylglucosaminide 3-alpha-L-fucosyltransferase 9-like [Solea solea]|uniref:4-galactosyl-N-acetylglucosaminide 3-alpha-L-fucosyltransferase 9-like n=1 Tax=Solea solea TaxID=90069 RepID=UPI00272A0301|nr:4-galactosyl-N-acetylglucosaminide 3-alpha-L-fucosyltransferase 9-like [Solea solea]